MAHKLDNIDKTDQSLKRHNLSNSHKKKKTIWIGLYSLKKLYQSLTIFQNRKHHMGLLVNSTKHLRRKNISFLESLSGEEIFPNLIYEASISLYQTQRYYKKIPYRSVLLINIDAKILSKILSNKIQQCIIRIIQYKQVGYIPVMLGWFNTWKLV